MKGYVYLLVAIDGEGEETHKIGISKHDPNKRVKELQTGSSSEIRLLNHFLCEDYKKIEKILHAKFERQRTVSRNEWFKLADSTVIGFVEECKKAERIVNVLKENPFY